VQKLATGSVAPRYVAHGEHFIRFSAEREEGKKNGHFGYTVAFPEHLF
jgi:hypothetical protein